MDLMRKLTNTQRTPIEPVNLVDDPKAINLQHSVLDGRNLNTEVYPMIVDEKEIPG